MSLRIWKWNVSYVQVSFSYMRLGAGLCYIYICRYRKVRPHSHSFGGMARETAAMPPAIIRGFASIQMVVTHTHTTILYHTRISMISIDFHMFPTFLQIFHQFSGPIASFGCPARPPVSFTPWASGPASAWPWRPPSTTAPLRWRWHTRTRPRRWRRPWRR